MIIWNTFCCLCPCLWTHMVSLSKNDRYSFFVYMSSNWHDRVYRQKHWPVRLTFISNIYDRRIHLHVCIENITNTTNCITILRVNTLACIVYVVNANPSNILGGSSYMNIILKRLSRQINVIILTVVFALDFHMWLPAAPELDSSHKSTPTETHHQ